MNWLVWVFCVLAGGVSAEKPEHRPSNIVLITLDTTRADAIGVYGGDGAQTPVLDQLAARGVRFETAISPAPLTLPAHATILTGRDPPEHGVRDNGGSALAVTTPTIASVLADDGWTTAAFVSSRVLDHRFGLAHGFDHYDDVMVAEDIGQYGYPERDARAVTSAALAWLDRRESDAPLFLWVHYYDPHAPYTPPDALDDATAHAAYLGEVAYVDQQIGRLLGSLPGGLESTFVVVAGDHGEALGDHGEQAHGIFLYRAVLEVPLIIAGPSIPAGRVIAGQVALRQVAPTVLRLVGTDDNDIAAREGLPFSDGDAGGSGPIYAEAMMPKTAYGWAPLFAVVMDGLKYIDAPRPELYDLATDSTESSNLIADRVEEARQLETLLDEMRNRPVARDPAPAPEIDAETRAALRSLGYAVDSTEGEVDFIDPKDGLVLLAEFERANRLSHAGEIQMAVEILATLVIENPHNAPFQSRYAAALLAVGENQKALAAMRETVKLQPTSEFARRNLGSMLLQLGMTEEARTTYLEALEIDPRSAPAWLGLAALAAGEKRIEILQQAIAAGVESVTIFLQLAEAEIKTDPDAALISCRRAGELAPFDAGAALCLGRVYLVLESPLRAAGHLRRAAVLGRGSVTAEQAERLLDSLNLSRGTTVSR